MNIEVLGLLLGIVFIAVGLACAVSPRTLASVSAMRRRPSARFILCLRILGLAALIAGAAIGYEIVRRMHNGLTQTPVVLAGVALTLLGLDLAVFAQEIQSAFQDYEPSRLERFVRTAGMTEYMRTGVYRWQIRLIGIGALVFGIGLTWAGLTVPL